jgi:plastocyanin
MSIRLTIPALLVLAAAVLVPGAPPASAGGGCHAEGLSDGAATELRLTQNCFEPSVARVAPGATVTWANTDDVAHTVTGARNLFGGYDELLEGDTYSNTFEGEGVFPYFCVLHPSMVGAIVVGDGVPGGEPASGVTTTAVEDEGGSSTALIAAIVAAIGLGGAAVGMVGTRLVTRKEG